MQKNKQDADVDGRLRPRCTTWRAGQNIRVVVESGLFSPLYDNMTSSTKPELRNVLLAVRGGPSIENLVKFEHVVFEICEQTHRDKQTAKETNRHADRNTSHLYQRQVHGRTDSKLQ